MSKQRLFIGNLPSDICEKDLRKLFHKYNVTDIEMKRKKSVIDEEDSYFAYVNIAKTFSHTCLKELRGHKLNGNIIRIEEAKENFMERLSKEQNKLGGKRPSSNLHELTLNTSFPLISPVLMNKKIKFNEEGEPDSSKFVQNSQTTIDEFNRTKKHPIFDEILTNKKYKSSTFDKPKGLEMPSLNDDNQKTYDVHKRRNLPMFGGIYCIEPESENVNIQEAEKIAEFSMKRFEDFSDVWRDDIDDDNGQTDKFKMLSNEGKTAKSNKIIWKGVNNVNDLCETNNDSHLEENLSTKKTINWKKNSNVGGVQNEIVDSELVSKKFTGENKRKIAMKEKLNSYKEQQKIIKNALKKNSVLKYENDGVPNNKLFTSTVEKISLFDNNSEDDEFKPDFNKPDDDSNQDRKFTNSRENGLYKVNGTIVHYDPTQVKEINDQNTQKKKLKPKKSSVNDHLTQHVIVKPEVSKEKHYVVSAALKNSFKKSDEQPFILSTLFEQQMLISKEETESVCSEKENNDANLKLNWKKATCNEKTTNLDLDQESIEKSNIDVSKKLKESRGIWGETFFFKVEDLRLREAENFYFDLNSTVETFDFNTKRSQLKNIVKKKVQNSMRDKKLFKQKLGGRINRNIFQRRLKKVGAK